MYRVVAARMEGMASEYPPHGQVDALYRSVFAHRLNGKSGTGRDKPATSVKERGKDVLVRLYEKDNSLGHMMF